MTALMKRAERAEAELFHHLVTSAPATLKARLGIATGRVGGGVLTSVRHDITGYWSNAIGLGINEPVTAEVIDRVIDFFTAENNPGALLHLAPSLLPTGWLAIVERHALRKNGARYQHACAIGEFRATTSTDLRIGRDADALEWTRFTMRGFGMPDDVFGAMLSPGYSSDNVQLFAAWDGDHTVGTAAQFIWEDIAVLSSGVTLPGYRKRGAQSAGRYPSSRCCPRRMPLAGHSNRKAARRP